MANGKADTDDGWYKTAHEFGAAESVADFSKSERVVLELVKAQVFGPAKRPVATIEQSDLARRFGYKRQFVNTGVNSLVKGRILIPVGQDQYKLNTRVASWKFRDGTGYENGSRFTDFELSQIVSSPAIAMSFKASEPEPIKKPVSTGELTPTTTSDESLSTNELTDCQLTSCQSVNSLVDKNDPPLRTPYKELRLRDSEKQQRHAGESGERQPGGEDAEADADRIEGIAELMADVCGLEECDKTTRKMVETAARSYGLEWLEAAVMSAAAVRPSTPWQYVNRLLVSYRAEGGPRLAASADPVPFGSAGERTREAKLSKIDSILEEAINGKGGDCGHN